MTDEELNAIRERNASWKALMGAKPFAVTTFDPEAQNLADTYERILKWKMGEPLRDIDALLAFVDKVRAEGYCPCGHSLEDDHRSYEHIKCRGDKGRCGCIDLDGKK